MFPKISLNKEDTLAAVELRLTKAIAENAKRPGIKPIYTSASVKKEAARLHQKLLQGGKLQPR
jgi:hypothetical protein